MLCDAPALSRSRSHPRSVNATERSDHNPLSAETPSLKTTRLFSQGASPPGAPPSPPPPRPAPAPDAPPPPKEPWWERTSEPEPDADGTDDAEHDPAESARMLQTVSTACRHVQPVLPILLSLMLRATSSAAAQAATRQSRVAHHDKKPRVNGPVRKHRRLLGCCRMVVRVLFRASRKLLHHV